jgi:hypothetical protein
MIWLDFRRDGTSAWRLASAPTWRSSDGSILPSNWAADALTGRRVLVLIHGLSVDTPDELRNAYGAVEKRMGGHYDQVVGLIWPAMKLPTPIQFLMARSNARKAGAMLANVVWDIPAQWDLQGHSLGAEVALSCMDTAPCRNVITCAAATDCKRVIGARGAGRFLVAFSAHDMALSVGYRLCAFGAALGLVGPRAGQPVESLDCSTGVTSHGGYKGYEPYYRAWEKLIA